MPSHTAALPPPWAPATTRAPQPTSVHRACRAPRLCASFCRPVVVATRSDGHAGVSSLLPAPEYRLSNRSQSAQGPNAQRPRPLPCLLGSGLWRWAKPHPPPSRPPFPLLTPQAGPRSSRPTTPRPPHGCQPSAVTRGAARVVARAGRSRGGVVKEHTCRCAERVATCSRGHVDYLPDHIHLLDGSQPPTC